MIAGVPVQFLLAWSPLVREAVATAAETIYDPADPQSRLREAGLVDDTLLTELVSSTKT